MDIRYGFESKISAASTGLEHLIPMPIEEKSLKEQRIHPWLKEKKAVK